jgi:hypothetical protein
MFGGREIHHPMEHAPADEWPWEGGLAGDSEEEGERFVEEQKRKWRAQQKRERAQKRPGADKKLPSALKAKPGQAEKVKKLKKPKGLRVKFAQI